MNPNNTLHRSTLVIILIAILSAYGALVASVGGRATIEAANMVVLSMAAGIVVAYWPVVRDAFRQPIIDGGDILSIGIFIAWLGVFLARAGSIAWRLQGKPTEWLDSAVWGVHISLTAAGAMCHLIAPEAIAGKVPTRHWVRVGLFIAGGIFLLGLLTVVDFDG